MKKPRVSLENYAETYAYYQEYKGNATANKIGLWALSLVAKPTVHFEKNAKKEIKELLDAGRKLIIASNHVSNVDPVVMAHVLQKEEVFAPVRGQIFEYAKASMFRIPPLRYGIDMMRAIPVFRNGDQKRLPDGRFSDKDRQNFISARDALHRTSIIRMNEDDEHLYILPEGTRGLDNKKVATLREGIGWIACATNAAIVPSGIAYGSKKYRPHINIGEPIPGPFTSPKEVLAELHPRMQQLLDGAHQSLASS